MFCQLKLDNSTLTGSRQVGINRGAFLFLAPIGRGAPGQASIGQDAPGHNAHSVEHILSKIAHPIVQKSKKIAHSIVQFG